MGVKPDWWIREMSLGPWKLIDPFSERANGPALISWGLQPASYDVRLARTLKIADWAKGGGLPLDPLHQNEALFRDYDGEEPCRIPPHGFVLGTTLEWIRVPRNCSVRGSAKALYSTSGVNVDIANIHPGWQGQLRLHLANTTPYPIIIYPGMGIVNLEFHEIDGEVERDYSQLADTRFMGRAS